MSEPMVLGGKLLSLLDESTVVATYKPALLMAIIDCSPELDDGRSLPVRRLAERAVELYWPQTVTYPTTGAVLSQNQGSQAKIVSAIVAFRNESGISARSIPERLRKTGEWNELVGTVELSLAEMPIPRLQIPFETFLYEFDWPWADHGRWKKSTYRSGSRSVEFLPGVPESLIALGPLLRPFIMRWWSEKAAKLNPRVEEARSMLEFEQFMFGRDRAALDRIAEGLLDFQAGTCFYCSASIARNREIDHFVPWSQSGDDGLLNLVAACRECNSNKRSILAGPDHLESILARNEGWAADLSSLANERNWPCDVQRSSRVVRAAYLGSPGERPLWLGREATPQTEPLGGHREQIEVLLGRGYVQNRLSDQ